MSGVLAVVGAQYGSEGKGVIVAHIAKHFGFHVRTGGPNAGHTFWHDGVIYKMQSIPCGWVNPGATLVIGRGAVVNLDILERELAMVEKVDPTIHDRLFVDEGAWCIRDEDLRYERQTHKGEAIGSTQEGIGSARMTRIERMMERDRRFGAMVERDHPLYHLGHPNTAHMLQQNQYHTNILLEGTQGFGLSLLYGEWPYVTSADTTVAQLCADCGIPPYHVDTLLVMRTYPIRVGGHSGPMKDEITWEELSRRTGRDLKEFTTVTKKLRRVAEWDEHLIERALAHNMPTPGTGSVALTFADYLDPSIEGKTEITEEIEEHCRDLERKFGVFVELVGTGGPHFSVIDRGKGWWLDD